MLGSCHEMEAWAVGIAPRVGVSKLAKGVSVFLSPFILVENFRYPIPQVKTNSLFPPPSPPHSFSFQLHLSSHLHAALDDFQAFSAYPAKAWVCNYNFLSFSDKEFLSTDRSLLDEAHEGTVPQERHVLPKA